jgi:hypothetical protein
MVPALTIDCGGHVPRCVLRFLTVSMAMTSVAVLGSVLAMAVPVRVSAVSHYVGPGVGRSRDSMMMLSGLAGLSVPPLYRLIIQSSRQPRAWITPGAHVRQHCG